MTVGTIFLLFCYLREIITLPQLPQHRIETINATKNNGVIIEVFVGLLSLFTLKRADLLELIRQTFFEANQNVFTKEQHFGFEAAA